MSTHKAWHFANGVWSEGSDPIMNAWTASDWAGDEEQILRKLGYKDQLFEVRQRPQEGAFEVWYRESPPRHVVMTDTDHMIKFLYVDSYPDVLGLVTQWASLARDLQVIEFIRDLTQNEDAVRAEVGALSTGLIETIVRRAKREWSR